MAKCMCGSLDCWAEGDYAWLHEDAMWRGQLHGFNAIVHFIHGKKVAEERHLPAGQWTIDEFVAKLREGSTGLPNAKVYVSHGSDEDGGSDFYIRGHRDPSPDDWKRLEEVRARQQRDDEREFERLRKKLEGAHGTTR